MAVEHSEEQCQRRFCNRVVVDSSCVGETDTAPSVAGKNSSFKQLLNTRVTNLYDLDAFRQFSGEIRRSAAENQQVRVLRKVDHFMTRCAQVVRGLFPR